MTIRRAALIASLVAALVYLPALGNRFALDDAAIVERNPAAHSIGAALSAFTSPYWPPEHGAGLWRPLVILSFAADWQISSGSTTWLHATNIVLHALVTALVVLLLARYLAPIGALAGGLVFAVHPVHVEAVANMVGRAELLAALFLLMAVLLSREVRRRSASGTRTLMVEAGVVLCVLAGQLSKEHAVIAIAWLWLDDRSRADEPGRLPLRLYVSVAVVTVVWLVVRREVEAGLGFHAVAPTFFGLGALGRISTMLPAVLVLMRLMVWPFDLSPDYHPMVIERLTHPTGTGLLGLAVLVALVMLAALLWRRSRAASSGLLLMGLAWLPTSNLLFASGIVLAERTLYLPSIGVALLAGVGAVALDERFGRRRSLVLAALMCLPLAVRSWTRAPDWRTTRDLVITALLNHPESFKVHQSAARVFWRLGLPNEALAEYGVAAEIYPLDYYLLAEYGSTQLEAGRLRPALRTLLLAHRLDSNYTLTQQLLAQTYLRLDSVGLALSHARRAVETAATAAEAARMLAASFFRSGQPDSAVAVWPAFEARGGNPFDRWLLGAVTLAAVGRLEESRAALDSATRLAPADTASQRRLDEARAEVLRPAPRGPR